MATITIIDIGAPSDYNNIADVEKVEKISTSEREVREVSTPKINRGPSSHG